MSTISKCALAFDFILCHESFPALANIMGIPKKKRVANFMPSLYMKWTCMQRLPPLPQTALIIDIVNQINSTFSHFASRKQVQTLQTM